MSTSNQSASDRHQHNDAVLINAAAARALYGASNYSSSSALSPKRRRMADDYIANPRKKRSKTIRIDGRDPISPVRMGKKPDPISSAASKNVTMPCSECGKKFWSWKALFGHMRCHPERQWRGINPPPNLRRRLQPKPAPDCRQNHGDLTATMTEEEQEVAACLLLLANGAPAGPKTEAEDQSRLLLSSNFDHEEFDGDDDHGGLINSCRFQCTSCKKVFGSHQALGGHRASHKNVKGCFAITKVGEIDDRGLNGVVSEAEKKMVLAMGMGHKCDICLKVFSSGQALGGHKRCHWEKGDDNNPPLSMTTQALNYSFNPALDLNFPAPMEADHHEYYSSSSYSSSAISLDLTLAL